MSEAYLAICVYLALSLVKNLELARTIDSSYVVRLNVSVHRHGNRTFVVAQMYGLVI